LVIWGDMTLPSAALADRKREAFPAAVQILDESGH
jgi:hypothetical protein